MSRRLTCVFAALALLFGLIGLAPASATPTAPAPATPAVAEATAQAAPSPWSCAMVQQVAPGDACSVTAWTDSTVTVLYTLRIQTLPCKPAEGCSDYYVEYHNPMDTKSVCGGETLTPGGFGKLAGLPTSCTVTFLRVDERVGDGPGGCQTGPALQESKRFPGGGLTPFGHGRPCISRAAAPPLAVAVDAHVRPAGAALGDEFDLDVVVTAGPKAVRSLAVTLAVPEGAFEITDKPKATSGLTLGGGKSVTLTWTLKGLKVGKFTIGASAKGVDAANAQVSASGSRIVPVSEATLAVTAKTKKKKVRLDVTKKGKVAPGKVIVTFTFRNTGKVPVKKVVLERAWPRPQDPTQPLDQLDFARKTFPFAIGTIKPGKKVTKGLPLEVTGDGKYKIDMLVSYRRGGTDDLVHETGGKFTVTVPLLWFAADLDGSKERGGTPWVKGGRSFLLSGKLRNLSAYKTLCLAPMSATFKGNAGGIGPVDSRVYGTGRDVIAPPVAGPIKRGETVPFAMTVRTRAEGGTRSSVKIAPKAYVMDADGFCDATRPGPGKPLSGDDLEVVPGSRKHQGSVDVSVPMAEPSSAARNVANFFGGLTVGTVSTIGETLQSTFIAAREAASGYSSNPKLLLPTLEAVYATAGFLVNYWDSVTPEEKATLVSHLRAILAKAPGDTWRSLDAAVSASAEGWMSKVKTAYETGDTAALYYVFGEGIGGIGTQVVVDMVSSEIGVGIAKRLPGLQRVFLRLGEAGRTYTSMKALPPGKLLNFTEARKLWGAAKSDWDAFLRIAREENVLIGVRSRAAVSVKNIEGGAVWKHENLKPKNVSPIDIAWLGFDKADNGLVALRSYSAHDKKQILARINKARLSATQRAEVLKRADVRFNEAPKYLDKIKAMNQKGIIDVGFNYAENGLDVASTVQFRNFSLTGESVGKGSSYYRPWQQNIGLKPGAQLPKWCKAFGSRGILCRVTGDMDGVYLTDTRGRGLPKEKLLRVYKRLADSGWQHPETFTWVDQMTGKFWFKAKEGILKGLTKGGEKMMEFGPDGNVRATWLNLKASKLLSPQDYFVARVGGMTATVK